MRPWNVTEAYFLTLDVKLQDFNGLAAWAVEKFLEVQKPLFPIDYQVGGSAPT
jgi:hypothetical protein